MYSVNCNSIGSFCFTLGNFPPKYRSRVASIQLLVLVKSIHVTKYGMDAVMEPFISDLKKLVITSIGVVCNDATYVFIGER